MKIFRKDKKLKKNIHKLSVIKQLKHNELLQLNELPKKSDKMSFQNFKLNDMILRALTAMNLTHATDIQAKILPDALQIKDILASEKTGSGKTLAYLIPLLNLVLQFRFKVYHGTCAIVIVPTKELCIQVCSVFSQLAQFTNVKFDLIHGDGIRKDEETQLGRGCTVLFATPNTLLHHMKASLEKKEKENVEYFRYHNLKFLVLDEADRLLENKWQDAIKSILSSLPRERQTMILSATLNVDDNAVNKIKVFAKEFLAPTFVNINISMDSKLELAKNPKNATVDNLIEGFVTLPANKRIVFLYSLIKETKDKKVILLKYDLHCSDPINELLFRSWSSSAHRNRWNSFTLF